MLIIDAAYRDIERQVLSHLPERGGGLLGPRGSSVVTRFIFDADAATTSSTYTPSDRLVEVVKEVESVTDLEFKGIIHSHPPGVTHPSSGDGVAIARFFETNPHRAEIYVPLGFPSSFKEPTQHSSGTFLSSPAMLGYKALRVREGDARVSTPPYRRSGPTAFAIVSDEIGVLPILEGAELLRSVIAESTGKQLELLANLVELRLEHVEMFGYTLVGMAGDIIYLAASTYPVCPPAILCTPPGGTTVQIAVPWKYLEQGHRESIILAANEVVRGLKATPGRHKQPRAALVSTSVMDDSASEGSPFTDGGSHGPSARPERTAPEDPGEPAPG